ncbi:HTH-type transcriptional repressor YcgE [Nocardia africana]|uniref:HTH-type transcriptional repressor YcgE n=2 Tax=Nocardia africana TaxID=134964 RepID=A0A378WNF4_9NOCA|nr:HTH-type transcriptional repressor YcgE [Nocardia africana]
MPAKGRMIAMPDASPPDNDATGFSVRTVAERIGIPTATLRSWNQRYGIGPSQHRRGRHRLYSEADIARLERMVVLVRGGSSPARAAESVRGPLPIAGDHASLLEAAFASDPTTLQSLLLAHIRAFGVVDTWDRLCRPAFAEIVQRQGAGIGCIDVEHLLSWCITAALHRAVPPPADASAAPVLLACTSGEAHSLPLEVLRAALAELDVPAHMLGPNVPTSALGDALDRSASGWVAVLWSQQESTALLSAVRTCAERGTRVLLAGPGWQDVPAPDTADIVDDLQSALSELTDAHPAEASPRRG